MKQPRSKESNENLLYHEVRNLARRLNEFQKEFGDTVLTLQESTQDQAIDIEQLTVAVEQLRVKLGLLESLLKDLR